MDLASVYTALTTWIETYSSLQCEWGRMPSKIRTTPFVLAYIGAITKQGHDEHVFEYDFDTDSTTETVLGCRQLILRLSFRSDDQRLGYSARQYAETFRVALHATTAMDFLSENYLAFVDSGELVETDYVFSGRMMSQVDMDVTLALRAEFVNDNHDGSYIRYVNIDTQEYVVDEDEVPVDNVADEYVTVDTD
jgi:hypothetical protein